MHTRRILILAIWGLAGLFFALAVGNPLAGPPPSTVVPEPGDRLDLESVRRVFQVDVPSGPSWILVLGDGCEASLMVSEQLPDIRKAADAQGVVVVPLIVRVGGDTDAMVTMLADHGFSDWGIADRDGFRTVRTWRVPTLIGLGTEGQVVGTTNASFFSPSWMVSPGEA